MDRRQMLKVTGATLAGSSFLGVPAFGEDSTPETKHTKKALIIGVHPDDPETGCGGTMILLKQAGYEVVSVYMTKGEGG
ncbi:MAG: PIG-L family deacetylase [Bacteroides sp.]|nr:PIG-L family deacetylase [Bacteroides sp.]